MNNRLLPYIFTLSLFMSFPFAHAGESIEYKLATINAGGYVNQDHITVARFSSLLKQLSVTFIENKQQIADMSVTVQKLLKKEDIQENLINLMEGMNQLFPRKIENQKYAEYAAAYVGLRRKGQTHNQAIKSLKAILHELDVR